MIGASGRHPECLHGFVGAHLSRELQVFKCCAGIDDRTGKGIEFGNNGAVRRFGDRLRIPYTSGIRKSVSKSPPVATLTRRVAPPSPKERGTVSMKLFPDYGRLRRSASIFFSWSSSAVSCRMRWSLCWADALL